MAPSYRVDEQPFIDAQHRAGPRRVGLMELLLDAHHLTDFHVPFPPAEAGFWRVLYTIAARVTGLDDPRLDADEWDARREEIFNRGSFDPDRVRGYFGRYGSRFDLFHPERPFLQDPRLAKECPKPAGVNRIVLGRPSGNTQPWFAHHYDQRPEPLDATEAVWHLLGQLYYGPSGRCSARKVGDINEGNTTAGPLRSALSFHPIGANLFQSLTGGLWSPPRPEGRATDIAPWEADALPDPTLPPAAPTGYAALVARAQHAILLVPDAAGQKVVDAYFTWAYRHPVPPVRDPYLIYQTSKEGNPYPRAADRRRAVFRDVDALLTQSGTGDTMRRPEIVDSLQILYLSIRTEFRFRALGFDQDGQTRDKQWISATTPSILDKLEAVDLHAAAATRRWRENAELAGRNLLWALRETWKEIAEPATGDKKQKPKRKKDDEWPLAAASAARYWAAAERAFWQLFNNADYDASDAVFFNAAARIFDEVTATPQVQPRVERARARHRRLIHAQRPRADTPAGGTK